jgi:hypothetical protein
MGCLNVAVATGAAAAVVQEVALAVVVEEAVAVVVVEVAVAAVEENSHAGKEFLCLLDMELCCYVAFCMYCIIVTL